MTNNTIDNVNIPSTKHHIVSCCFRLNADGTASYTSQPLITLPFSFLHIREADNQIQIRYDNAGSRRSLYTLGTGDRQRHHVI